MWKFSESCNELLDSMTELLIKIETKHGGECGSTREIFMPWDSQAHLHPTLFIAHTHILSLCRLKNIYLCWENQFKCDLNFKVAFRTTTNTKFSPTKCLSLILLSAAKSFGACFFFLPILNGNVGWETFMDVCVCMRHRSEAICKACTIEFRLIVGVQCAWRTGCISLSSKMFRAKVHEIDAIEQNIEFICMKYE